MSAPQPPLLPPPPPSDRTSFARAQHTLSLGLLIACPVLIILPPRKLDLYTFSLSAAWLVSANHVVSERSGKSILGHVGEARWLRRGDGLPSDRARETQERLRLQKERNAHPVGMTASVTRAAVAGTSDTTPPASDAEEREGGVAALSRKLWMGGEREGWKERRVREEREALEEGRGYGGLILDQIWEVWNWGKGGDGEGEGR